MAPRDSWVVVLAGGDGTRLRALTADPSGRSVPKQFCSLSGGRSLLGDALARARGLAPPERTLAVVAAQHRVYWEPELAELPPENVLVQPCNRGTGPGLLLPLAVVAARDPAAVVVVLPSDHHVSDEGVLAAAVEDALRRLAQVQRGAILLGIEADAAETGYGWILAGPSPSRLKPVCAFVEKPDEELATRLLRAGALWNSFVLVARARTLLELQTAATPELAQAFRPWLAGEARATSQDLEELYERIAPSDFSHDVLQRSVAELFVLPVPSCGWTDLGTPQRVLRCLRSAPAVRAPSVRTPVVLRERLAALSMA